MAAAKTPIKWTLKEVDKKLIRPNPNNPKIRNEKGFSRLSKLSAKFGVIYDGVLNLDLSIIDGHSRLELYPTGIGRYFVPDRQLSESDEKELNALFDLARAGDPDMFMIEQLLDEESMDEWNGDEEGAGKAAKPEDKNAKYPLVPQFDEKHESIVILCSSSLDTTFIKDALGIEKAMSYKNKMVKETSVVTSAQFIKKWKSKS
jgi:hypothetical protein